jgi:hypothetical protein
MDFDHSFNIGNLPMANMFRLKRDSIALRVMLCSILCTPVNSQISYAQSSDLPSILEPRQPFEDTLPAPNSNPERTIVDGLNSTPPPALPTAEATSEPTAEAKANERSAQAPSEAQTARLEKTDYEYEVLNSGALHEAFATAPYAVQGEINANLIAEPPPAPINEHRPELEISGNNIQWIQGYWDFDRDLQKYVWISGLYREVPPDRQWVPGFWNESAGGYLWTSGFWGPASSAANDLVYLPQPPRSVDNGPSSPPPSPNSFWIPGEWVYVNGEYQWHAGFWTRQQENWVWQPACYIHSPRGYVYVSGYWDYEPSIRGDLYAPIAFQSPVYTQPNYYFLPRYRLARTASLLLHVFVRPGYPRYFYGNFYGPQYASIGYVPWYHASYNSAAHSPWLGYYSWKYAKQGIAFSDSMVRYESHFRSSPPARQAISLVGLSTSNINIGLQGSAVPRSFDSLVKSSIGNDYPRLTDRLPRDSSASATNGTGLAGSAVPQLSDRFTPASPDTRESAAQQLLRGGNLSSSGSPLSNRLPDNMVGQNSNNSRRSNSAFANPLTNSLTPLNAPGNSLGREPSESSRGLSSRMRSMMPAIPNFSAPSVGPTSSQGRSLPFNLPSLGSSSQGRGFGGAGSGPSSLGSGLGAGGSGSGGLGIGGGGNGGNNGVGGSGFGSRLGGRRR